MKCCSLRGEAGESRRAARASDSRPLFQSRKGVYEKALVQLRVARQRYGTRNAFSAAVAASRRADT
jgi:hypothetical protein